MHSTAHCMPAPGPALAVELRRLRPARSIPIDRGARRFLKVTSSHKSVRPTSLQSSAAPVVAEVPPASAPADLDALTRRLAEGDRAAFTPLYRLLSGPVLAVCRRLLTNDADAADAAQQALANILARADAYDPRRPALPWALGIATWECRTLLRKRWRRREAPEDAAPVAKSPSPEEALVHQDLVAAALTALEGLSELDRETLRATYWELDSHGGGATFRKRRERALGRLRAKLRSLYGL